MNRTLSLGLIGIGAALLGGCITTTGSGDPEPHFASLYSTYLSNCSQCHAPGALGATSTTEKSLDFSTVTTAYATLGGSASSLVGNQQACNGVPFIAKGNPGASLLLAVLDGPTRSGFDAGGHPGCDSNAISDMALKSGKTPSAAFIAALKTWIQNGAPND